MNTGPADTHAPHLDLEDLIAEGAGQPVSAAASKHLASCADCRAEANRWNVVADGVRGVPAATPETAQRVLPRQARPRLLARPGRRTMLGVGAAAAAVVLLGVAGYGAGVVHVSFGQPSSGPATGAALTAVGGCPALEQAVGVLEQVNGSSLVIKTASGQLATLTTTAATTVDISGALASYITNGAPVTVAGTNSGGTIAAAAVNVGRPARAGSLSVTGAVTVRGTVTDLSSTGFTVVTSGGSRVPVTISGETMVAVYGVSLSQLRLGTVTMAIGNAGPNGTLAARAVVQPMIGHVQAPPGPLGSHRSVHSSVHPAHGCSPTSLADALGGLSYGG